MEITRGKDGSYSAFFGVRTVRERDDKKVIHCGFIVDEMGRNESLESMYSHCCAIGGSLFERAIMACYQF